MTRIKEAIDYLDQVYSLGQTAQKIADLDEQIGKVYRYAIGLFSLGMLAAFGTKKYYGRPTAFVISVLTTFVSLTAALFFKDRYEKQQIQLRETVPSLMMAQSVQITLKDVYLIKANSICEMFNRLPEKERQDIVLAQNEMARISKEYNTMNEQEMCSSLSEDEQEGRRSYLLLKPSVDKVAQLDKETLTKWLFLNNNQQVDFDFIKGRVNMILYGYYNPAEAYVELSLKDDAWQAKVRAIS